MSAPPIKAVTPRWVERKPRAPGSKDFLGLLYIRPLPFEVGHRGLQFNWDQPPPRSIKHAQEGDGSAEGWGLEILGGGGDGCPTRPSRRRGDREERRTARPQRPLNHQGRPGRGRRDFGAKGRAARPRGGACAKWGGGVQVCRRNGRCIRGGLAAGGYAGQDWMGRGLDVRENVGVGLPWGVSAGEGYVWICEGDGHD